MYHYVPLHILSWRIVRTEEALLCLALGLVLGLVSFHAMNGLAIGWRALSVWMLSSGPARRSQLRSGPVVIP